MLFQLNEDYGIVGDAMEVLPILTEELRKVRTGQLLPELSPTQVPTPPAALCLSWVRFLHAPAKTVKLPGL